MVDAKGSLAAICWGSSIRASKRLNKLIKKTGFVLVSALELLELVVERRLLHKLLNIMDNTSAAQPAGWRLLQLHCSKDRYRKSFLPTAIRTLPCAGRGD